VRVERAVPDDPAAPGPREDADPITSATGCTEVTAGAVYDCPGVTRLVINVAGGNDGVAVDVTGIPSTVNAGAGDDFVLGGSVADTLNGDAGADFLFGDDGDDVLDGGDGDDDLRGSDGNDRLLGGAGDDAFFGSVGNDDYRGGPGFDTANAIRGFALPRANTTATLDDQANDALSGTAGEADNVHLDIEELAGEQFAGAGGSDTFTGSPGPDSLSAAAATTRSTAARATTSCAAARATTPSAPATGSPTS
jgi:Ca2+-binding RTX toxin-like protein